MAQEGRESRACSGCRGKIDRVEVPGIRQALEDAVASVLEAQPGAGDPCSYFAPLPGGHPGSAQRRHDALQIVVFALMSNGKNRDHVAALDFEESHIP